MSSVFLPGADALHLGQPTLDEILADSIFSLILRRDDLTAGAFRATLDRERRRLASHCLASHGLARVLRRAA